MAYTEKPTMNYTQVKHTKCEKKNNKKEKRHHIHVSRDDSVLHCDCDQQIWYSHYHSLFKCVTMKRQNLRFEEPMHL